MEGGEICNELRKRMVDACCLQQARWRVLGFRMLVMEGMKCRMWWC